MSRSTPPRWADRLLEACCAPDILEDIQGDLHEWFSEQLASQGPQRARLAYGWQVVSLLRPELMRSLFPPMPNDSIYPPMILHYFKIAWRQAMRNRFYASLNVLGLAIGMASCILILLYVKDELSYDRYHQQADRIYRLNEFIENENVGERSASLPFPAGPALQQDYPDLVAHAVRFFNFQAPTLALEYVQEERFFNEKRLFFVDSTLLDVFSYEVIQGNPEALLDEPFSLVLTERMVEKYFGEEDPIGKTLRFQDEHDLMVTGVLQNPPANSHFQFDFLASFSSLKQMYPPNVLKGWYWNPCWTYVKLAPGATAENLERQLPDVVEKYFPEVIRKDTRMHLQALTDIHLHSHLDYEIEPNGTVANVYIFSGIALFILLIACINFVNLATARAINRAREVGMRKTLGGQARQLMQQFLTESLLTAACSLGLALLLVGGAMPFFNALTQKSVDMGVLLQSLNVLAMAGVTLLVGLGAGLYPALYLTAFDPVEVLKGGKVSARGRGRFRRVLVVAQFSISILLMVGTGVAFQQLTFLQRDDPGFQRAHIVMLPILRSGMAQAYETYKDEVLQAPSVLSVTAVEEVLGAKYQAANYQFEGWTESRLVPRLNVRHDFVQTFNMQMAAGRPYDEAIRTDDSTALLVNEALVRHMGWPSNEDAIGRRVYGPGLKGRVVGVVKDFNFASKHQPIRPLVLTLNTRQGAFNLFIKYMAIRIDGRNTRQALTALEHAWQEHVPDKPFDYFFLDKTLEQLYVAEQKLTQVAGIFAMLATVVACLGLLGLASYTALQKRREIGIRKVLGSTSWQIVLLLSRDVTLLVLVACAVSLPLAWALMHQWLSGFAYRVAVNPYLLAGAGGAALLIAWLTIAFQSWRAARTNPADSLRHE